MPYRYLLWLLEHAMMPMAVGIALHLISWQFDTIDPRPQSRPMTTAANAAVEMQASMAAAARLKILKTMKR